MISNSASELRIPLAPARLGGGLVLRISVVAMANLLLAINLLLCAARLARSWWWQDDLNLLAGAAGRSLSPGLLFSDYNGHLVPGTWVLAGLFDRVAPLQWWPAAVVTLGLVAAIDLSMLALLRRVFGTRPAILVPFAITAATSLTLTSTLWWAASLQWLPITLSLALGLWFHVGFWETGRVRDAAGAIACVVLGVAFFEKGLTTLLVLALFAVLYGVTGPVWRRPWRALIAHPWYWMGHAAVAGGFLGIYLARVTLDPGESAGSAAVLRTIRWMLLDTLIPSLIGGPINWYTTPETTINAWPHPPPPVAILAWVLAAVAILGSIATRRGAWRAWTLLAIFLTVSVGLVVRARLGFIGPFIGRDHRYLTDAAVLVPLCLALAWLRARPGVDATQDAESDPVDVAELSGELVPEEPVNLFEPAAARHPGRPTTGYAGELLVEQAIEDAAKRGIERTGDLARRFTGDQQAVALAGALAVVLVTVGGAVSGERFMTSWSANPTKPYFENLAAGIDAAKAAGRPVNLLPATVPPDLIMTPLFEDDRRLSQLTRPWRDRPGFPSSADSYSVVDAQGRLHPADVPPGPDSVATGRPGQSCAKAGQNAIVTFPAPQQALRWTVKVDYLAQSDTNATLSLGAYPGVRLRLRKGLHTVYVDLLGGASSQLVLNGVDAGSSVCVGRATIGTLTATG